MGDKLVEIDMLNGTTVRRYEMPQLAAAESASQAAPKDHAPIDLPDWAQRPAPIEPSMTIPLAPSRLAPLETDDDGEFVDALNDALSDDGSGLVGGEGTAGASGASGVSGLSAPSDHDAQPILRPSQQTDDYRFARGNISHALLEHLPSLDPASWEQAAKAFIAARGQGLPQRTRNSIANEVLGVLRNPDFAPYFGPNAQAEVPIVAEITRPDGKGPPLCVTGQIDRLAILDDEVLIIDYKTNRPPPFEPEKVASAYLLQLAAYRLAVATIFPDLPVRAAILWTDGVRIMEIPHELLAQHEQRLWRMNQIKRAKLDA